MARAGDAPRSRRVLRLIALERSLRSLLLLAAGIYLLSHLKSDFGRIADHFMRALELDPRPTSLLLPLELYELVSKPSLLKAGGIVVNIAIVAYLAWMLRRRLARGAARA
jgi:hypothetical protein